MNAEATTSSGLRLVRRLVFHYLLLGTIGLQVASVAAMLGLEIPVGPGIAVVLGTPLLGALALERLGPSRPADQAPLAWTATGLLIFGLWAGGYFAIGMLVDPGRIRFLPETIEPFVPLVPAISMLYLSVHPFSILPYFLVEDVRRWHRLVTGHLFILAISFICWTAFPVSAPRPELPPPTELGGWTLGVIYWADPSVNCLPSTHCAMALFAAFVLLEQRRVLGVWAFVSALVIGASTLLTKQHYFVDVVSGFMLASVAWVLARRLVPVDLEQPVAWEGWRHERI